MSDKKLPTETVSKALEALQDIAKGHSSRGTASTTVDSMRDAGVGAGNSSGATQVFHTPANSEPGTWAGSKFSAVPEDGATDAVSENGTDYDGGAKMAKSILRKMAKGLDLSAAEAMFYTNVILKGMDADEDDAKKANPFEKKDEEDTAKAKKDDDKDADDMDKSLAGIASQSESISKGFEMSDFLSDWVRVQSDGLTAAVGKINTEVKKSLGAVRNEQVEFNAALAKSITALAETLALQAQRIDQVEQTPTRGPKSQVVAIEKGFGAGEAPAGDDRLTKSQILDGMLDLVKSQAIQPAELIRFESTGDITAETLHRVRQHLVGR